MDLRDPMIVLGPGRVRSSRCTPTPLRLGWARCGNIVLILEFSMRKTLTKRGNSAALTFTRDMLELLGVEVGDDVRITFQGRRMIVESAAGVMSDNEFDEHANAVLDEYDELFRRLADR